jgi:hypothetical protein
VRCAHAGGTRHPDGGGLTAEEGAHREQARLAATMRTSAGRWLASSDAREQETPAAEAKAMTAARRSLVPEDHVGVRAGLAGVALPEPMVGFGSTGLVVGRELRRARLGRVSGAVLWLWAG